MVEVDDPHRAGGRGARPPASARLTPRRAAGPVRRPRAAPAARTAAAGRRLGGRPEPATAGIAVGRGAPVRARAPGCLSYSAICPAATASQVRRGRARRARASRSARPARRVAAARRTAARRARRRRLRRRARRRRRRPPAASRWRSRPRPPRPPAPRPTIRPNCSTHVRVASARCEQHVRAAYRSRQFRRCRSHGRTVELHRRRPSSAARSRAASASGPSPTSVSCAGRCRADRGQRPAPRRARPSRRRDARRAAAAPVRPAACWRPGA